MRLLFDEDSDLSWRQKATVTAVQRCQMPSEYSAHVRNILRDNLTAMGATFDRVIKLAAYLYCFQRNSQTD